MLIAAGYAIVLYRILPDERKELAEQLRSLCDQHQADLILTTGGTGFSPRDYTPEATLDVAERLVPGIPEAMRAYSLQKTNRAMLSRGVAVIRGRTLIINLPGSPRAAKENLECILPALEHGLAIMIGTAQNCGLPG
jgi:molybdenum cofactor synthesis domain-containing protein